MQTEGLSPLKPPTFRRGIILNTDEADGLQHVQSSLSRDLPHVIVQVRGGFYWREEEQAWALESVDVAMRLVKTDGRLSDNLKRRSEYDLPRDLRMKIRALLEEYKPTTIVEYAERAL